MKKNLFSDFNPVDKATWKEKVVVDLKGADFDKKLLWKTENGMVIPPYFNSEDALSASVGLDNIQSILTSSSSEGMDWKSYQLVVGETAEELNENVKYLLERGVEGLVFNVSDIETFDFEVIFEGAYLNMVAVGFEMVPEPKTFLEQFKSYLTVKEIGYNEVNGYLNYDPIDAFTTCGAPIEEKWSTVTQLIQNSLDMPHFKTLVINSNNVVNAGGNHVQEVGLTLSMMVEALTQVEVPAMDALNNLYFKSGVGGDYFHEIAKYRAMRALIAEVATLYDANYDLKEIEIEAVSSAWSKSLYDPNVNMLRNTSEAMSAVLGGVNVINIYPHNMGYEQPNSQSQRVALNISHLLREEAYFGKVADPAAGSYYLDALTKQLMDAALNLFRTIEDKGGFVEAFAEGIVTGMITEVKDAKEKLIAQRRSVYVGSNKYPNQQEHIKDFQDTDHLLEVNGLELLVPQRATEQFDALRLTTEQYIAAGHSTPEVFNLLYGNLAMRKARSTFASDFFGTAGFESKEQFYDSAMDGLEDALKSPAQVVVMCSSDAEYAESVTAFAQAFKAADSNKILVLAGHPGENEAAYIAAGVDKFVHVRTNAIEELNAFQSAMNIK